jgi:Holliday junction resolvasome RuvABC endonuclease subunit
MSAPEEYVWGVDVAVQHLAFAFAPVDNGPIVTETLTAGTDAREGQRLGLLDRQVRIYAQQVAVSFPPQCVWVEQPTGRFPKPQLMYAAGVVQAALFEALACPVWTIPVATWKQRTVGKGNATKSDVFAWATGRLPAIESQDEADAYCIAAAGRAMLNARSWEAAA